MLKSILCALDGSAYSQSVLDHGIKLSQRLNAELRFISIIDIRMFEWVSAIALDGFVPAIPGPNYMKDSRNVLEVKANDTIDKALKEAKKFNIPTYGNTEVGVPADIICDESRKVDFVIMGRRGEFAQWSGQLVGATLEAVSHQMPRPLLVVDKEYQKLDHMIFAYDASECSSRALKTGMDFAEQLGIGATVVSIGDKETTSRWQDEGKAYCRPYKIEVEFISKEGSLMGELKALHKNNPGAFVTMGSHGKSRLREAILGSTTLEILRKVDFPVIVQR